MTEKFNQGYALLIGVGESAYERWSLPVTVKDTQAIYAALIDPDLCAYPDDQEHIRILNDDQASREAILAGLQWLKEKAETDPEATILVYYSGHGSVEEADNHYYLLQHDIDPLDIADSALSSEQFTNALRQIKSQRLLVVLDCCHAAGMATSKEEAAIPLKLPKGFAEISPSESKGLIKSLAEGKGRVVFTSCQGEQKSWIKDDSISVYTFHFLEALQGAGNQLGETQVKVSNLMNYLGETVPKTAQDLYNVSQTPHFDFDTSDFAVALLQGGKGLPAKGWEEAKPQATEKINQIAQVINQYGKYIYNINKVSGSHFGDVIHKSSSEGNDELWLP